MSETRSDNGKSKDVEVVQTSTSKMGKTRQRRQNKYVDEWIRLPLGSSNAILENDHDLRDPYMYYRDSICPYTNGYDLFIFFYINKFKKPPSSTPRQRNFTKLIFPEVYVDVGLLKALIESYNPKKKSLSFNLLGLKAK